MPFYPSLIFTWKWTQMLSSLFSFTIAGTLSILRRWRRATLRMAPNNLTKVEFSWNIFPRSYKDKISLRWNTGSSTIWIWSMQLSATQNSLWAHTQSTLRDHSEITRRTLKDHPEITQKSTRDYSEITPRNSENMQRTQREHKENTRFTCGAHQRPKMCYFYFSMLCSFR